MGIVRKQSTRSLIFSYIGIVIGFISQTFIFTNLLSASIVGLIRVFQSFAGLFSEIAQMSVQTITGKFFPHFRNKEKGHHGFLFFSVFLVTAGFVVVFIISLIFRNTITGWYTEQSPLFVEKYFYAFPIAFALIYLTVFESYLRLLYNIIYSTIVKEIYIRVFSLVAVLLYYYGFLGFDGFLIFFSGTYALASLLLLIYIFAIGEFHFKPDYKFLSKPLLADIRKYASYTYFTVLVNRAILELDKLMVASLSGLGPTGVYGVTSLMASVISLPMNAISNISSTIVSEAFKVNDLLKVKELYKKAAINQFVAGSFIFLVIWLNVDQLLSFMPQEYRSGKMIILIIGISRLVDMICGISGGIIILSRYYNFIMYSSLAVLVFMFGANIFMIKAFGITGAAYATLFSVILHNLLKVSFIRLKFGFQPFDLNTFKALLVGSLTFLAINYLKLFENPILDILLRSLLITIVFWILTLGLKVSDDMNQFYKEIIQRIRKLKR